MFFVGSIVPLVGFPSDCSVFSSLGTTGGVSLCVSTVLSSEVLLEPFTSGTPGSMMGSTDRTSSLIVLSSDPGAPGSVVGSTYRTSSLFDSLSIPGALGSMLGSAGRTSSGG